MLIFFWSTEFLDTFEENKAAEEVKYLRCVQLHTYMDRVVYIYIVGLLMFMKPPLTGEDPRPWGKHCGHTGAHQSGTLSWLHGFMYTLSTCSTNCSHIDKASWTDYENVILCQGPIDSISPWLRLICCVYQMFSCRTWFSLNKCHQQESLKRCRYTYMYMYMYVNNDVHTVFAWNSTYSQTHFITLVLLSLTSLHTGWLGIQTRGEGQIRGHS